MNDLSLVSEEALINELAKRNNCIIYVGVKDISPVDRVYLRRWFGDSHRCSGLCMDLSGNILAEHNSRENPIKGF
jgi:hypothetical protein